MSDDINTDTSYAKHAENYTVTSECTNCTFGGPITVPYGIELSGWVCPSCGCNTLVKMKVRESNYVPYIVPWSPIVKDNEPYWGKWIVTCGSGTGGTQ